MFRKPLLHILFTLYIEEVNSIKGPWRYAGGLYCGYLGLVYFLLFSAPRKEPSLVGLHKPVEALAGGLHVAGHFVFYHLGVNLGGLEVGVTQHLGDRLDGHALG